MQYSVQQNTAWLVLWSFFMITILPIMPITPVFAHDMAETCSHQGACKGDCHGGGCHGTKSTPADLVMTDMDMPMPEKQTAQAKATHTKPVTLTSAQGTEKVACDCGCQSTPDQFPIVLTPFILPHVNFQTTMVETRSTFQVSQTKITRNTRPNIPPPKLI